MWTPMSHSREPSGSYGPTKLNSWHILPTRWPYHTCANCPSRQPIADPLRLKNRECQISASLVPQHLMAPVRPNRPGGAR